MGDVFGCIEREIVAVVVGDGVIPIVFDSKDVGRINDRLVDILISDVRVSEMTSTDSDWDNEVGLADPAMADVTVSSGDIAEYDIDDD